MRPVLIQGQRGSSRVEHVGQQTAILSGATRAQLDMSVKVYFALYPMYYRDNSLQCSTLIILGYPGIIYPDNLSARYRVV